MPVAKAVDGSVRVVKSVKAGDPTPVIENGLEKVRPLVRTIDSWICQHCKKSYTYMPSKCTSCNATDPAFKQTTMPAPEDVRKTYRVKASFLYGNEGHISKGVLVSLLKDDSQTLDLERRGIIKRVKSPEQKAKEKAAKAAA